MTKITAEHAIEIYDRVFQRRDRFARSSAGDLEREVIANEVMRVLEAPSLEIAADVIATWIGDREGARQIARDMRSIAGIVEPGRICSRCKGTGTDPGPEVT